MAGPPPLAPQLGMKKKPAEQKLAYLFSEGAVEYEEGSSGQALTVFVGDLCPRGNQECDDLITRLYREGNIRYMHIGDIGGAERRMALLQVRGADRSVPARSYFVDHAMFRSSRNFKFHGGYGTGAAIVGEVESPTGKYRPRQFEGDQKPAVMTVASMLAAAGGKLPAHELLGAQLAASQAPPPQSKGAMMPAAALPAANRSLRRRNAQPPPGLPPPMESIPEGEGEEDGE